MAKMQGQIIHASAIGIDRKAVLLIGRSGSGKSDLALRLIDRGAHLLADDQVMLTPVGGQLIAYAPRTISGKIEVRGLGIVTLPFEDGLPVRLCIELDGDVPRYPMNAHNRIIEGINLPLVRLNAFEHSAPIKVEHALARLDQSQHEPVQ